MLKTIWYNFYWAMPEVWLSLAIVTLLAYGVIYSKKEGRFSQQKKITWLSIIALLITFLMVLEEWQILDQVNFSQTSATIFISAGLMGLDPLILLIKLVLLLTSISILLLSLQYYAKENLADFEYTQLILLSTLGMLLLVSSKSLIFFYLAIELISLSLYVLAALQRHKQLSTEAGLKYFLLGALSSGLLLFGCALIYTTTGLTEFDALSQYIYHGDSELGIIMGAMFIFIALFFKLAAAPFHMWAPDVYEGAPTIVTAYFAIVPKIATLGILVSFTFGPFFGLFKELQPLFLFSAVFSVVIASIGALNQSKIKRLMAYSAIGHMGFIFMGIGPGTLESIQASFIYIIIYIIMSINSFALILSSFQGSTTFIAQLSGLSRSQPILAITFALCLMSVAGIPPLAGFFSKYMVLISLVQTGWYTIAIIAVLASALAGFYYMRIIKWMFFNDGSDFHFKDLGDVVTISNSSKAIKIDLARALLIGSTFFIILTLLIHPDPLLMVTFDAISGALL